MTLDEQSGVPVDLDAFVNGETNPKTFHHGEHVRMAFELLRRNNFADAASAYTRALKIITARAGAPGAYHETMTIAFLSIIAERSAERGSADFAAFVTQNPDVMCKSILERWYAPERLKSDIARATFILPAPLNRNKR